MKFITISDKKVIKQTRNVQEKINLQDIEGKNLIDVESYVQIHILFLIHITTYLIF